MYIPYQPQKLFVTNEAANEPRTEEIIKRLPALTPQYIKTADELPQQDASDSLLLARQKSGFFKRCPGTQNYICCGYKILNLVNNCELNCSYCILQGYLNNPQITAYVNLDDLFVELNELFAKNPARTFRIGTGELADSLSTDHITRFSPELVSYFSDKSNAWLELKTKTTMVDFFINIDHGRRTVVSWSMNTPRLIASDESQATTVDERLEAAQKCQEAGFRIGFHFDPMIYYDDWEKEYKEVIDRIFRVIAPENIAWISLGALRYPPYLDGIIRERHPNSKIVLGELITGLDGKMRYFKKIRIRMFGKMYRWIRAYSEAVFTYLCMESSEIYQQSFGWSPKTTSQLARRMNQLVS